MRRWTAGVALVPTREKRARTPVIRRYDTVFNDPVAGFTLHSFSTDLTKLTTDFYDSDGTIIHSFTADKQTFRKKAAREAAAAAN